MSFPTANRRDVIRLGLLSLSAAALSPAMASAAVDPMSKEAVLFDPEVPVLGNPKGDVTLVEFFDYQCPYCKSAHPGIARLVAKDGKVRHVMKDWPIFGAPSEYASRLTLAAGRGHAKAQAALMATKARLTIEDVDTALAKAGFDPRKLQTAYEADRKRIDGILQRNGVQAQNFGLMGTPAYIVGTVLFPGVMETADLEAAVVQARRG